jgi:molecular chaperone Hsp33
MSSADFTELPVQDVISSFTLDKATTRGRFVRLGPLVDEIVTRHSYPAPVARVVAEAVTLCAALSAMLKFEGVFTLQAKGKGPIGLVVADILSDGTVRGYAQYDAERLGTLGKNPSFRALLGVGYLAFTVDQGGEEQRYQGIVELQGESLEDGIKHYFRQSEQMEIGLKVAVQRTDAGWQSGAILLQRLPDESEYGKARPSDLEDSWRHSMVLLSTVKAEEIAGTGTEPLRLLFNLFHEQEVEATGWQAMQRGCRCSREKVENVLIALPAEDIEHLKVDGKVTVTCEFCNESYRFDDGEIGSLLAEREQPAAGAGQP